MAMAHKAPAGYKRRYIVGNAVVEKARVLVRDLAHWPNGDLGNYIDVCVHDARASPESVENWWEDSFAHGIQQNTVVRIDGRVAQAQAELYAVITDVTTGPDVGREIIVTLLDAAEHERAIAEGRWQEKKPARSRYRHPGEKQEEQEEEAPPEPLKVQLQLVKEVAVEEEFVVSWPDNKGGNKFEIVRGRVQEAIEGLVVDGVPPGSIRVWKNVPVRVKVVVEFE